MAKVSGRGWPVKAEGVSPASPYTSRRPDPERQERSGRGVVHKGRGLLDPRGWRRSRRAGRRRREGSGELNGDPRFQDSDELRSLIAQGRERGYLTFEQIAATLEEVEVTKEQVRDLHALPDRARRRRDRARTA